MACAICEHRLGSRDSFERLMGPCSFNDSHPLVGSVNTLILTFVQLSTTEVAIIWKV